MDKDVFRLSEYNFLVPPSLIAQEPVFPRDSCRLLIIDRKKSSFKEGTFKDIGEFLGKGDLLVLNNTKVIKARLKGRKEDGSSLEVLLLKEREKGIWEVLVKPGRRARIKDKVIFEEGKIWAKILDKTPQGGRILEFYPPDLDKVLERVGKVPLPPYIKKEIAHPQDYQTVYAQELGAVAAPTAGLHFTQELIEKIKEKGGEVVFITLHCSLATFRPVKTEDIREHKIEPERVEISPEAARILNTAKEKHKRIIGVGTTSVRALESAAFLDNKGKVKLVSFAGETNLYITPGYKFKVIDALITNFHTPCSTNFILVASFCGLKLLKESYSWAKSHNFRFFSFGDAMLIV